MKKLLTAMSLVILLVSCQKELSFDDVTDPGGSSNGDLLVKALEISPATGDTNVITFQWDANKRLTMYNSAGKVQGTITNINHTIARGSNGNINTIVSKTEVGGFISDSVVYRYTYVSGGNRVAYFLSSRQTVFGDINDSTVVTYDANGKAVSKERLSDFPLGILVPFSKEVYEWDANGNVTKITGYAPDANGMYQPSTLSTYTYDAHKAMVVLGEESLAILGAANQSKNNSTKLISNAGGSGNTYTFTYSQFKFNSFDRPTEAMISITPQPPGYNVKVLMFYK